MTNIIVEFTILPNDVQVLEADYSVLLPCDGVPVYRMVKALGHPLLGNQWLVANQ